MGIVHTLILFQLLVFIPFAIGLAVKKKFRQPKRIALSAVNFNLVVLEPLIALWSIWGIALSWEQVILPLGGIVMGAVGLIIGMVTAPLTGTSGKERSTYIISSALANHGITMGGVFCYLLMGERGLALSFIFITYFMPFIFLVIFPYARRAESCGDGIGISLRDFILDKRNMPLAGFFAAFLLRGAGFTRPEIPFPVGGLIMASLALYYFSMGITVIIKKPGYAARALGVFSFGKFVVMPVIVWGAVTALDLRGDIGYVLQVQAIMPAAIYSVLTALLFNLDTELASTLFVYNTLIFAVLVAPLIFFGSGIL